MSILSVQKDTHRIGEIIVAGPSLPLQKRFITHLCNEVVITSNSTVFGRSKITDELQLFFYGIGEKDLYMDFAWDLVAPKMLGYVLVYNWFEGKDFTSVQQLLNILSNLVDSHGIVVGDIAGIPMTIDRSVYESGFSLSSKLYLSLWDSTDKTNAKNVLKILIDSLINHLE
ncbi:hypothetical protein JXA02_03900 [candidate division KSB1 bacterium]|nr:hypothetical protein [candidate division KSB1 bacterium]RQW09272.1 MAG: hypothetical protein EH222_04360 [candidate division KSB1 bacterium]